MPKLNQIIALASGKKSRASSTLTQLYHNLSKTDRLTGISRTYSPKNEDGEQLPPESKRVQFTVADAVKDARGAMVDLLNIIATQDASNCQASAPIVVDGQTLATGVPVTTLLAVEKQLTDLNTLVSSLPTLDPAYEWTWDASAGCYRSAPTQTNRTKKVLRNHVKAKATDKFPEQVDVYTEDETIGYWTKTDFSGAIPATERNAMWQRVSKLQDAVKSAREAANSIEAVNASIGAPILDYVFGLAL